MMSSRRLSSVLMAAALIGAAYSNGPAFPSTPTRLTPRRFASAGRRPGARYPFASTRQNARRYISVVGRNGHATMQKVK